MENLQIEPPKRLFSFDEAKINLQQMISAWQGKIVTQAKINRAQRKPDLDIEALQKAKIIDENETIIPIRTINTNVDREQGTYLTYIQQSPRVAIFRDKDDPARDLQDIDTLFTNGMTYDGWITTHTQVIDGCQTHGWDSYEVVFDISKPFHLGIEQVGFENLIFPLDAVDIQYCEVILRSLSVSLLKLEEFVANDGFDLQQVKLVQDKLGDSKKNDNITIYKVFFKWQGVVWVAWYEHGVTTDWLKAPAKLFLGRQKEEAVMAPVSFPLGAGGALNTTQPTSTWTNADEVQYPFFMLFYDISENKKIVEAHKGRAFLDKPTQEGQTAIASSVVNGCIRASGVFGSPDINTGSSRPRALEETPLIPNRLYDTKVVFWSTPWPDAIMLNTLQALGIQNAQEAGQVDFAAANKKDSRKTAKEMEIAERKSNIISGVKLINFSGTQRSLYTFIWVIVCGRAKAGIIHTFDGKDIKETFDVRPAGDIDVVEKQQTLDKMRQDWPVIATTPIASAFLKEYIKISYPNYFASWALILESGDPQKVWIQKIMTVLPSLVTPEEFSRMSPEIQQQLKQLLMEGQQALQQI